MSTSDIQPFRRPRDLVNEADYRAWVLGASAPTELPWDADPLDMVLLAETGSDGLPVPCTPVLQDSAIHFGGQEDAGFSRVTNWVQVDDLGGMGVLWCGSHRGVFYLKVTTGSSGGEDEGGGSDSPDSEPDIAPAAEGEELEIVPVCDTVGGWPLSLVRTHLPQQRRACPMSKRDRLLKVGGKWRSDLHWDILINGPLSLVPPGYTSAPGSTPFPITTDFYYITLRLIQVGHWLCFHTQLSTYGADDGCYYAIGYSPFDGRPFLRYGTDMLYLGFRVHGWTAEPPWGRDLSNSWRGDAATDIAPSQTPETADTPYCRVFPRLTIGEGWFSSWYNQNGTTAAAVESTAENYLTTYWRGGSPDWMEDYLGIAIPPRWDDGSSGELDDSALYLWRYQILPAASPTKIFSAHLPHPGGAGSVYLSLHTATIDGCLLTACCCNPYHYS